MSSTRIVCQCSYGSFCILALNYLFTVLLHGAAQRNSNCFWWILFITKPYTESRFVSSQSSVSELFFVDISFHDLITLEDVFSCSNSTLLWSKGHLYLSFSCSRLACLLNRPHVSCSPACTMFTHVKLSIFVKQYFFKSCKFTILSICLRHFVIIF